MSGSRIFRGQSPAAPAPDVVDPSPWVNPARIRWRGGVPESKEYGDTYFSRCGGEHETQRLFVETNRLPQIWRSLPHDRPGCFCIGETGFGTGLNFVCAWRNFLRWAPPAWRMLYFSFEKHPLQVADRAIRRRHFQSLDAEFSALDLAFPTLLRGWHRRRFAAGRITLNLYHGEALDGLESLLMAGAAGRIHCWFLDGFAPACNADLWGLPILQRIASLTSPGGSCATFTVAGKVRRCLQEVGFRVVKTPGAGAKREFLFATKQVAAEQALIETGTSGRITVVGAGFAGCWSARLLAERGWQVRVLDAARKGPGGASAVPVAAWHPRLHRNWTLPARWRLAAAEFAAWQLASEYCRPTGLLQFREATGFAFQMPDGERSWRSVAAEEASDLSGIRLSRGGIWFARGGFLSTAGLRTALLDHARVEHLCGRRVTAVRRAVSGWRLLLERGGIDSADRVILANAWEARVLVPKISPWVSLVRGQADAVAADDRSLPLRVPLVGSGYVLPAVEGTHWVGASHRRFYTNLQPNPEESRSNLTHFAALTERPGRAVGTSFVAIRCAGRDHAPLVGRMEPGLYLNLGHGGHGLTQTPLASEWLAAELSAEPIVDTELRDLLNPGRFAATRGIADDPGKPRSAERVGFEPTMGVNPYTLSRRAP